MRTAEFFFHNQGQSMLTISAPESAFRLLPLVACVAASLTLMATTASAAPSPLQVQNCDNDGTGSLRDIVDNVANSGDIVDLSALPMACGTITLASEIGISQDDLTFRGPSPNQGSVTITSNHVSRILHHTGGGTLTIDGLTVADGTYLQNAGQASGGCIFSFGDVFLNDSMVTGCIVKSSDAAADGAGIFADGTVTLFASSVSGNQALAPMSYGRGGGIWAYGLNAKYATLTNNYAQDGGVCGAGGGAFVYGDASILTSTIDSNRAGCGAGLEVLLGTTVTITNSTISENLGSKLGSVRLLSVGSARVSNSTIAFNQATADGAAAGVFFGGTSQMSPLTLQSSIVANNTAGANATPSDIFLNQGTLVGNDNVVIAANVSLQGIAPVQTDPMLGPLQFNGGPTRTRALLPGSPAIGAGNDAANLGPDQRGHGYPRTTGTNMSTDIGAYEFDSIFFDDFDQ